MSAATCVVSHPEDSRFARAFRGPYHFFSREVLPEGSANALLHLVRAGREKAVDPEGGAVPEGSVGVLGGRSRRVIANVTGLGRVFVKRYSHGGALRWLLRGNFVRCGAPRSQGEFEMLERVRALGVHAPKPLVFVTKGSLLYRTWLVMHELTDVRTLVEVSMHDEELLGVAMERLAVQMRILLAHRIVHVDLHPGNVLVTDQGVVSLVDFDKARVFAGSLSDLCEVYLRRWRRAVIKHRLSPVLTERMSLILRSHHDGI